MTTTVSLVPKVLGILHRPATRNLPDSNALFRRFRELLEGNNRVLQILAEMEDKLSGEYIFDAHYIRSSVATLSEELYHIIVNLNIITGGEYPELFAVQSTIQKELEGIIEGKTSTTDPPQLISLDQIDRYDEDLVGRKNANLGEIRNHIQLKTPSGFVVTAAACYSFLEHAGVLPYMREIVQSGGSERSHRAATEREKEVERVLRAAEVPPALKRTICGETQRLLKRRSGKCVLAVRGSVVGEDALGRSCAGRFGTLLNVSARDVLSAYKKVVTVSLRQLMRSSSDHMGEIVTRCPIAVGVQEMIDADVAGVAYSVDPRGSAKDSILVSAVYGLGAPLVSGTMNSDIYRVSRFNPSEILEKRIVNKEEKAVAAPHAGIRFVPVPTYLQPRDCLNSHQLTRIAEVSLLLERAFRRPQDIEWAIDRKDDLFVLQSRPLIVRPSPKKSTGISTSSSYRTLLKHQGLVANRGISAGRVREVSNDYDGSRFPAGAIAVTRYSSPRLANIIRRAGAIITDVGSSMGHMATMTREIGVPAIVGTAVATERLHDGMDVTVDAIENVVYEGISPELLEHEIRGNDLYVELPEYKVLGKISRKVSPLRLNDPNSPTFKAKSCRTYHDIIRFSHEKAMRSLIELNVSSTNLPRFRPMELELSIPLGLRIIDIGGGLNPSAEQTHIVPLSAVNALPLTATLEGLTSPKTWRTDPVRFGLRDFVASLTEYSVSDIRSTKHGKNFAVISDYYMNLNLKLGFHFNVVDAYVSPKIDDNYIYFRCAGGIAEKERRRRRAVFIKTILQRYDFNVDVAGDLVSGRVKKRSASELGRTLVQIGRLIGFTRQLDIHMKSDASISHYVNSFFEGDPS